MSRVEPVKYRTEGNVLCSVCADGDDDVISSEPNTMKDEHCDCCGCGIPVERSVVSMKKNEEMMHKVNEISNLAREIGAEYAVPGKTMTHDDVHEMLEKEGHIHGLLHELLNSLRDEEHWL